MTNDTKAPIKAQIRVEAICPESGGVIDRIDLVDLRAESKTVRCEMCWDEHDLIVPQLKVKGE